MCQFLQSIDTPNDACDAAIPAMSAMPAMLFGTLQCSRLSQDSHQDSQLLHYSKLPLILQHSYRSNLTTPNSLPAKPRLLHLRLEQSTRIPLHVDYDEICKLAYL